MYITMHVTDHRFYKEARLWLIVWCLQRYVAYVHVVFFIVMSATFLCLFQFHSSFLCQDMNGFVLAKINLGKVSPVTLVFYENV